VFKNQNCHSKYSIERHQTTNTNPYTSKQQRMTSLTAHLKGGKQTLQHLPVITQLSPLVWRFLGGNPSSYTLNGTNTYLIGQGPTRILLDTGAGNPSYSNTLINGMKQAGCLSISKIIISHWHHDHLGGVPQVLELNVGLNGTNAIPIHKYMPVDDPQLLGSGESAIDPYTFWPREKFIPIQNGDVIQDAGVHLTMLHTPGHANDHVVAILEEENAMFTADNVLGVGTAVFNNLSQYLQSLTLMKSKNPNRLYPGHGPLIENGIQTLSAYIEHRLKRVIGAVNTLNETPSLSQGGKWTLETLTRAIYIGLAEQLIPPAMSNTLQVLEALRKEGIVDVVGKKGGDEGVRNRKDEWKLLVDKNEALRIIDRMNGIGEEESSAKM
tara:strand:- start:214 stop:1359 length:1146 start_codon:yes stop_codon:yes gene_type:complete